MDRSERRWRTAKRKTRLLRLFYEYGGRQRAALIGWRSHTTNCYFSGHWLEKPWAVIPKKWFMGEHNKAWNIIMHIRPARRQQSRALRMIEKGAMNIEMFDFPNYRRPHTYYW